MEDWGTNGFFTGVSSESSGNGTRPGFAVENEKFELRFMGIQFEKLCSENERRLFEHFFISCYDWKQVMELVFKCFEYYHDKEVFQIDCQTSIKAWLSEFGGWGLMFTLLPMEIQELLIDLYSYMNIKNRKENVVKSNLEMFEGLMELYKTATQGLPLSDLVPRVEVRLLNFISDGSRGFPTFNERMKMVTVKIFSQHFALTTYLSVEKKRLRRSLVEPTAEVVAGMVDNAEKLEISDKIIDADWVLSYWLRYMKYKQK